MAIGSLSSEGDLRRFVENVLDGVPKPAEHVLLGAGSPEGVVTADPSMLYRRADAPDADHAIYFKGTGSGNTGWQRLTSTGYAAA